MDVHDHRGNYPGSATVQNTLQGDLLDETPQLIDTGQRAPQRRVCP
jgi:hypothetical protein